MKSIRKMKKTREQVHEEALLASSTKSRRGLVISMRVGKTRIGLREAQRKIQEVGENCKILIVAPKKSIFTSWNLEIDKIGAEDIKKNITYSTYVSLNKKGWDYDLVIFDESHSILESHLSFLRSHKGDILGLTGTPPIYENSAKGKLADIYFPTVFTYTITEAVESNILNDYRIIVHLIPLDENNTVPVKAKGRTFYTSEKKNYDYWTKRIYDSVSAAEKSRASIMRMKSMHTFPSKEVYAKKLLEELEHKCIVFANTKEQADKICKYSIHSGNPDAAKNLEFLVEGKIDKASCVLQLSEGITITGLQASIILHGYGNENKFTQRFGRCLSLNPDDLATIHLLAYENTVDAEKWVPQSLELLDQSKIKYNKFRY